ncbi:McrB family protein [Phaeocystidibacter luteus]|uniref:AAA domain-containing protein n=1 Tax=Phaeocystidibacter luteus TaxID=911197 RepID=A0A6N6RG18_9FLAO|nr:AAA family ATPase [Phaeocystidibacter luteus]KAB2810019.1 AAA domain-containing protein [Phaeocystidibacter luteus]
MKNIPESVILWHRDIFEFLSHKFKEENGPKFWIRQRQNEKTKAGLIFQGTASYAYISFHNGSGGQNMTRSIGWVQHFDKQGNPDGTTFEINFPYKPTKREEKEIEVYHKIKEEFPQLEKTRPTRYQWDNPTTNGIEGLEVFIKDFLPKINRIIEESKIETLEIPTSILESSIERVRSQIESDNNSDPLWEELVSTVKRINNTAEVTDFFKRLQVIIKSNKLTEDDPRTYYSCRDSKLIHATFGSHYGIWIESKKSDTQLGFVVSENTLGNAQGKEFQTIDVSDKSQIDILFTRAQEVITKTLSQYESSPHRKRNEGRFNPWIYRVALDSSLLAKLLTEESLPASKTQPAMKQDSVEATNRIYFGPPGTGKTYELKENLFSQYSSVSDNVSEKDLINTAVQNLKWWEVLALGLVDDGPCDVSTLLENRWVKEKIAINSSKEPRRTVWGSLQNHSNENSKTVNVRDRSFPFLFDKDENSNWYLLGDTFSEIGQSLLELRRSINENNSESPAINRYMFCTFHQSFTYEDFVEGIKPTLDENEGQESSTQLSYEIKSGAFKLICQLAKSDPDHRYAIFIDEINRGNVAAIFGELITLIEADKREGEENEISVTLPYSKQKFSVPSNLDIYGTMNTADRSVEALDSALRRRFEFVEVGPKPEKLGTVEDISMSKMLEVINARLTWLKDKDHTIGHAYFMRVDTTEELRLVFKNKVVPLLEEYFFNAPEEIKAVLGDGFVEEISNPWSNGNTPDGYDGEKIRIRVPDEADAFMKAIKEGILGEVE